MQQLNCILYNSKLYEAEHELSYYIKRLLKTKVEAHVWHTSGLLHRQPQAVVNACTLPISILTGPPGTGKTTTLKLIIDSFHKAGLTGRIACPFGKAAKRAHEVVNAGKSFVDKIKCSTVHSLLEYDYNVGGFRFNRFNKLKLDYLVIDEFSTLDCELARDVLEAIDHKKTRLILSGDYHQLPSVGPGNIARDLINCGIIPTTELDVVMRTGENSGITYNANCMLQGKEICKTDPHTGLLFTDFFFVPRKNESETVNTILSWVTKDLPEKRGFDSITDIQVLSPGKKSLCGTKNMNRELRDRLSPSDGKTLEGYRVGDKVINNKNSKQHNIVNGDVGFVKDVIDKKLLINFGDGSGPQLDGNVEFTSEMISGQLSLSYTLTVHKSQGSEFKVVIIPIHKCHTILLNRNLVYTGLTRGRELGMYVGDSDALRMAIKNTETHQRKTGLCKLLQAG